MLERYFFKIETIDNIKTSWLCEPIELYVSWLADRGYSFRTVCRRVPILMQFGEFAQCRGALNWNDLPAHVAPFVDHWVKHHAKNAQQAKRWVANDAQTPVDQMLSLILTEHAGYRARHTVTLPFTKQVPTFFQFLSEERELKKTSLHHYGHYLRAFEAYLKQIELSDLKELSPAIVSAFIINNSHFSKTTMTGLCSALRVFLRYLHSTQLHQRDLSITIESPRNYKQANLPRSVSWNEVQNMFDTVDHRTNIGKRDYTILLLLVTYGLRGNEVATLTLDHIDWERERMIIPDRKAGNSTAYPLSSVVGEALLEYITKARPSTADRHVFFRLNAPRKPVTSGCISSRVKHYLLKAGITVYEPGSHTLRHTCVQRLVDASFPFKVIGDYVGHASPSSTAIYTKIDLTALREVAMGHGAEL